MTIHSNVSEHDMTNLCKIAEQQKKQRAHNIENRILKETQDRKLAESVSPISRKYSEVNETIKNLGEMVKKSDVEDGNTQTPAIQIIIGIQSLRDTLELIKRSEMFFK